MSKLRFIILLLFMISCTKAVDYCECEYLRPIDIVFDKIKVDTPLANSDNIFVLDSCLIVLDNGKSVGIFDLYSLNAGKFIGSVGSKGRGPEEFNFINDNGTVKSYSGINVAEFDSYSIVDFLVDSSGVKLNKKNHRRIPAKQNLMANSLLVLSDSTAIIYIANNDNVEFYLHNSNKNTMTPISYYPKRLAGEHVSSDVCSHIFLNDLLVNTVSGDFAAVYSQLPMIRIFDRDGNLKSTSLLSNWEEQQYEIMWDDYKTSSSYQYYLATTANSKYICGLYLGKLPSEMKNISMEDARMEIHIWNWEGELVATYIPDCLVLKIAISDDNTIYAVSPLDDDHIYSFNLGSNH